MAEIPLLSLNLEVTLPFFVIHALPSTMFFKFVEVRIVTARVKTTRVCTASGEKSHIIGTDGQNKGEE